MKKKTKLIGAIFALCTSLCMLVVGVLAASQVSLNVSSSVSFEASGVYVKAKGEVQKGNDTTEPTRASEPSGSDYYYIGYSYDAQDEEQESDTLASDYNDTPVGTSSYTPMTAWTIGEVEFSETENIIRYSLTFTNYSEKDIQATITTNKDTFMQDADVQGKVEIEETSTSIIIGGYDGTAQTGTYAITMKLTDFSSSFANKSLTIDVNFSTDIVPTANYKYFNIQDNVITSLTDTYFEDSPEVLVVPGYSEEGETPLSIGDGSYSTPTFNGLSSPTVIIQEGIASIGNFAFYGCVSLTNLEISGSVKIIGSGAFVGCNLISVNIPKGVTSIGEYAFNYCERLSSVVIANSVTSIGPGTFSYCSSLTSVTIPDSVTNISTETFSDCSSLSSIIIPDSVISIGDRAFWNCSNLASVTLSENVKSISVAAFSNCSSLSSITIPGSVTSIGNNAFQLCIGLREVYISSLEKWCEIIFSNYYANPLCYAHKLYLNNELVTDLKIPEDVTSIGDFAFYSCYSLTSVTIPKSVTSIGSDAFYYCTSLKYIHLQGDLNSSDTLSGIWVKTNDANEPTSWTPTVDTMQTAGYYHQQSAWESAT